MRKLSPYFTFELLLYNLDFITNVAVIDLQISVRLSSLFQFLFIYFLLYCVATWLAVVMFQIYLSNHLLVCLFVHLSSYLFLLIFHFSYFILFFICYIFFLTIFTSGIKISFYMINIFLTYIIFMR